MTESATKKERAEQLLSVVSGIYSTMLEMQLKNSALLVIVIGWLASSETLQKFIKSAPIIPPATTVAMLLLPIIYIKWMRDAGIESTAAYKQLNHLNYFPRVDYQAYRHLQLLVFTMRYANHSLCNGHTSCLNYFLELTRQ
ncbi:hypothetical protein [Acaryochloris marina]|uniref:Uncharacterized protein n=1 Tax=Acaryochloris marina (strain MBIC 11017) TaxID=329726 RepID=A8ZP44_ACAM1|nr:hypothetical protein [Acaryochloris marina]ABW32780.1 hypothetical protein AM1_E0010 [Acaryochloris marina MBIC11017]